MPNQGPSVALSTNTVPVAYDNDNLVLKAGGSTIPVLRSDKTGALDAASSTALAASLGNIASSKLVYHIIVGMGQSNMSGRAGAADARLDPTVNHRVWTFDSAGTYAGKIVPASEPLGHFDTVTVGNTMGPLLTFANAYAALVGQGVRVLIVPCAYGGTGFTGADPVWDVSHTGNVAGNYYDQTVTAVKAAQTAVVAAGAQYKMAAFVWHQGENDALTLTGSNAYYGYLSALINAVRANIPNSTLTPFICGQMVPEYISLRKQWSQTIDAVHQAISTRIPLTGFALGISGAQTGDLTHYNQAGQRALGQNYLTRAYLPSIQNSTPVAGAPGQATGVTLFGAAGTSQWITWTAPGAGSPVTEYLVYYRVTGGGVWTLAGSTNSVWTYYQVTGLTAGTSYDYKVVPTCLGSPGPDSSVATGNSGAAKSLVLADNFTRANAATLGTTSTGGFAWSAVLGTWGITNNKAVDQVVAGLDIAVVDSGKSDCVITFTLGAPGSYADQSAIVVRYTDTNNLYWINGKMEIYKKQAGTPASVAPSPMISWIAGDVVTVTLSGNNIVVAINGVLANSYSDSFNATATKHGMLNNQAASTFQVSAFSLVG